MATSYGRGTYGQRGSAVEQILAEMAEKAREREAQQQQEAQLQQRMKHESTLADQEMRSRYLVEVMRRSDDPRVWEMAKAQGLQLPDFRQLPAEEARDAAAVQSRDLYRNPDQQPPGFGPMSAFQVATGASLPAHGQVAAVNQDLYTRPNMPPQMVEGADITSGRKMTAKDTADLRLDASRTAAQNAASYANAEESRARAKAAGASGAAASGASAAPTSDVAVIAQAIIDGEQPPELKGLYKNTLPVRAELARRGYDLTKASQDWQATQRYMSTMNGPQITRLRQATEFTYHSLDLIDELNTEWDGSGYPALNKARLVAAKQGVLGPKAQSIATRLESQIADMVSELAVVYRGGGASTEEALRLAAENLKSSWGGKTLSDNIAQVRKNLDIRRNSLKATGVVANAGNRYEPQMGDTGNTPPPSAVQSGARKSKTQVNKRTGEKRTVYSDDGGATWHP